MKTVDHSDPDYGAAWACMNEFGGVERTLTEVVLDVEEVPSCLDLEFTLNDLFLLAFLAGAKYGRTVIFQMG
jgi:hypothetical protein